MRYPNAFTLIELLVVVTIIVVLLAMLTPALDKAIYQAELTVCGSKLHGIGAAILTYASANRRSYPTRLLADPSKAAASQPSKIHISAADDRPFLRPILSVNKQLQCPLVRQIDIDYDVARIGNASEPAHHIYASYSLFHGWYYSDADGGKGLKKIGDRMEYSGDAFSVLAADAEGIRPNLQTAYVSHPDSPGALVQAVDEKSPFAGFGKITESWWVSTSTEQRPPVDMNYLFDDGSVRRYNDVLWNEWDQGGRDFRRLPENNNNANPQQYFNLPLR